MARFVFPKVNRMNANRASSEDWLRTRNAHLRGEMTAAVGERLARFAVEQGTDKVQPEMLAAFTKD